MKGTADYVAELLAEPDKAKRQIALARVPAHQREDVRRHVERYWPQRGQMRRAKR